MKKSSELRLLISRLSSDLGPGAFEIVDHCDGDLCAVGFAKPGNPFELAYVCTFGQPENHYYLDLESSSSCGTVSSVVQSYDAIPYEKLQKAVANHLGSG